MNIYAASEPRPVSGISVDARARFVVRTYLHLFGAILGFTLIELVLYQTGLMAKMARVPSPATG